MPIRRKRDKSAKAIPRFVTLCYEFARSAIPPMPFTGLEAIFSICKWLSNLKSRRPSVPKKGKYRLELCADALGVEFHIELPSVGASARGSIDKPTEHDPFPLPIYPEGRTNSPDACRPAGRRLLFVSAPASIRVITVRGYRPSIGITPVVFGLNRYVDRREGPGCKRNDLGDAARRNVGSRLDWPTRTSGADRTDRRRDVRIPLPDNWGRSAIDYVGNSTSGTVQATLTRLAKEFGFPGKLKIRPSGAWLPTCARHLLYPREDREKLGMWDPGSLAPDRYDRAISHTELMLRGEILSKVREDNWRPAESIEVPKRTTSNRGNSEIDDDTTSVTSTSETSTSPHLRGEIDIPDLTDVSDKDGPEGFV